MMGTRTWPPGSMPTRDATVPRAAWWCSIGQARARPAATGTERCVPVARAPERDNRRQGCGMAPASDLLLVAMDGQVSSALMARAIEYCVDPTNEVSSSHPHDGADVISCSLDPGFVVSTLGKWLMYKALRYCRSDARTPWARRLHRLVRTQHARLDRCGPDLHASVPLGGGHDGSRRLRAPRFLRRPGPGHGRAVGLRCSRREHPQ